MLVDQHGHRNRRLRHDDDHHHHRRQRDDDDHDQRNTLNTGFTATLPHSTWLSTNVYYGSGFTNGLAGANQGPWNGNYLPVHTTFDLSGGHSFGENWRLSASILNVTNHRVLLDNSVTIGGFHYNDPRMLSAQLKYRFHF